MQQRRLGPVSLARDSDASLATNSITSRPTRSLHYWALRGVPSAAGLVAAPKGLRSILDAGSTIASALFTSTGASRGATTPTALCASRGLRRGERRRGYGRPPGHPTHPGSCCAPGNRARTRRQHLQSKECNSVARPNDWCTHRITTREHIETRMPLLDADNTSHLANHGQHRTHARVRHAVVSAGKVAGGILAGQLNGGICGASTARRRLNLRT